MGARRGQGGVWDWPREGAGQRRAGLGLFLAGHSGGLVTVGGQAPAGGQRDHLDPVGVVASALAILAALMLGSSPAGLSLMSLLDPTACVTPGSSTWRSLAQR